MRKHLSVLGLWARCSLYKILGVLAVMGITEYMLFYFTIQKECLVYKVTDTFSRPEFIIDRSGVFICFASAFLIITVLLSVYGCQYGSKTGYTLRRLSVNEKYVFLYQAIYNLLVYLLLWTFQVILCFLMLKDYVFRVPAEFLGDQSLFLAFYRSDCLHSILPLSDGMLWARNALLLVTLSIGAAEFPYLQRRGKKSATVIALSLYTVALWKQELSPLGRLISTIFVAIVVIYATCYQLFFKEETADDKEETDY